MNTIAATSDTIIAGQDLFGDITLPSTSVIGLIVTLPHACICGATDNVIGSSSGPHHGRLKCIGCDRHRGWLSGTAYRFITDIIDFFGRPQAPISVTFKNSRTSADNPQ